MFRFGAKICLMTLVAVFSTAVTGWSAIQAIMNEVGRGDGATAVVITFIDHSGYGIARYRVQDNSGAVLRSGDLECPRTYVTEPPMMVPNERFPLVAGSSECGESGLGSAAEGYVNQTALPLTALIPIPADPSAESPCSTPAATREEGGTPCAAGRDAARASMDEAAAEIRALCEELARLREAVDYHDTRATAYAAAAAVLLVAALVCLLVSTLFPGPVKLILQIAAGVLFVAALVTGTLHRYHAQEAERARGAIVDVEEQIEAARDRYRDAVSSAIGACCGIVPSGLSLDPPECED